MEKPQCLPGPIWFMVSSAFDSAIDFLKTSKFYDLTRVKVKVRVKLDPWGQG